MTNSIQEPQMTIDQKPAEPIQNSQNGLINTKDQPAAAAEDDWLVGIRPQQTCNIDPNDPNSTCESCT